jgi:hypothetical protein
MKRRMALYNKVGGLAGACSSSGALYGAIALVLPVVAAITRLQPATFVGKVSWRRSL